MRKRMNGIERIAKERTMERLAGGNTGKIHKGSSMTHVKGKTANKT